MQCLILASGFATRLYPLTLNKAKPLLIYKNRPVLTHIVNSLPDALDIFITVNKKFETDFRQWQKDLTRKVKLVVEDVWMEEQSLGAIGSLNHAIKSGAIRDDILVLAGDNYFEFSIFEFLKAYDGNNALIAVYDIGNKEKATEFGVVLLDKSKVIEFEEKPAQPKSSLVATGCYIFPLRIFRLLEEYCDSDKRDNLGDFIKYLVDKDKIYAWIFEELWFDIGSVYGSSIDK